MLSFSLSHKPLTLFPRPQISEDWEVGVRNSILERKTGRYKMYSELTPADTILSLFHYEAVSSRQDFHYFYLA